ncbi:MAG: hypothetical protein KGM49_09085 [Sphingomonadales bacterium]|nr:hypothetical protein [Sphingomonadales bacterium]
MSKFVLLLAATLSVGALSVPAAAADTANVAKPTAVAPKFSTAGTDIGTLLDNPEAKAIVEKHIPGLTTNDQIEMARPMTLKAIQQYAPEQVTDERLAAIDVDLSKLK